MASSRRSGSAATVCLGQRMPRGVLHLHALRSRTSLLQPDAASKPDSSSGGAPTAATNRARKAGSIIATASGNTGRAPGATARDGSRFPFDHFPGIIRLWTGTDADRPSDPAACRSRWPETRPALWLRCRICGRTGRFIDPFPRIPRRR